MKSIHQPVADHERRFANLIRFGTVQECDYEKPAFRVRDGKLLTGWLPMLQLRNTPTAFCQWPYEKDEPVCFLMGSDGQGVILGAVANSAVEPGVMKIKSPVEQTGGDMTSDGVSAQHHTHDKVKSGVNESGEPVK